MVIEFKKNPTNLLMNQWIFVSYIIAIKNAPFQVLHGKQMAKLKSQLTPDTMSSPPRF